MHVFFCALVLALALSSGPARAEPLRVDRTAETMRVDGALKEWRGARFTALGSGDDASLRYALASAEAGLYVAAEVTDDELVTGDAGDALVLALAMPDGSDLRLTEIWLHPGARGKKAHARVGTGSALRVDPRVQVVEGPPSKGAGWVLEALIPWAVVRNGEIWEQGRGALRLIDVDRTPPPKTLTSATALAPADLPHLVPGFGQNDPLGAFMVHKGLSNLEPRYDFRSNVSGDARPERVVIVDRFVVVYGPGYLNGETYNYYMLPYGPAGGLKRAELLDVTGDGKAELLTLLRQDNPHGVRELWQLVQLDDETIQPLFAIETRKELKGGMVDSTVTVVSKGQKVPRIDVRPGRALGLDALTYPPEMRAKDAESILLPWDALTLRSYAWNGKRFAVVNEEKRATPPDSADSKGETPSAPSAPAERDQAPPPAASVDALLAQVKATQQLPASAKPTRTLEANVLSGPAPERIDVFGSLIVLTGPDIAGGSGYLTYGAPVADARDLLEVRAADVTSDGGAELLLRVRQVLSTPARVERELLVVVHGDASGRLARVLTAEVTRKLGDGAIENAIVTQQGTLTIEPGSARGWTKASYPFDPDAPSDVTPILLPWRDRPVRYHLVETKLQPAR